MSYTAYWESLHQWFWSQTGPHKIQLLFLHKCPEQPSKFVEYIRQNYFMLHSLVCMFNRKQVRPFYGKKRPPNCPWKTICKKVHLTLTSVQIVILWKAEHSCEQNTLAKSKHATKIYFAYAHLGLLAKFGLFFFFFAASHDQNKRQSIYFPIFFQNPQVFQLLRCQCLDSRATKNRQRRSIFVEEMQNLERKHWEFHLLLLSCWCPHHSGQHTISMITTVISDITSLDSHHSDESVIAPMTVQPLDVFEPCLDFSCWCSKHIC